MSKLIWNRIQSLRYISLPLFLCHQQLEITKYTHERKSLTHEIPTRKKLWTHEIPTKAHGTMAVDPRDRLWHTTHEI